MSLNKISACIVISVVLIGCVTGGGTRIDHVPMYGQPEIQRPDSLKKADEEFINKAVSGFGTRERASQAWWAQGEKYMSEGNLGFAMRRYNQSWLLNPNNYQPYWGFARVQLELGKIDDALKYLEKAESLVDDDFQKVALLADMGSAYTMKGTSNSSYFTKANNKFEESTKLDSEYPDSWRRWAFSLYEQGKYNEAKAKVDRAKKLNARQFPPAFLSELNEKLSEQ